MSDLTECPNPLKRLLGNPNTTTILIEAVPCLALIDTGSQVTTVSRDFYNQHLSSLVPLQPLTEILTVTGAGGNVLPYDGYVQLDLVLDPDDPHETYTVLALVLPGPSFCENVPVIIGTNFMVPYLEQLQQK